MMLRIIILIIVTTVPVILLNVVMSRIRSMLSNIPEMPELKDRWWGDGYKVEDTNIRPFKVDIKPEVISGLKKRLQESVKDLGPPLHFVGHHYGMNSKLMKTVVDHWINSYNWTERQMRLNQFNQYITKVQGLDIHFYWHKPKPRPGNQTIPLLLLHGWGSSVVEYVEVLSLLRTTYQGKFHFHVVVPSLPGFGFSQGTNKSGLGVTQMAVLMKKLMVKLKYPQFYVHGSNFGGIIAASLGAAFPDNARGVHSTNCVVNSPLALIKYLIGTVYPRILEAHKDELRWLYPVIDFITDAWLESGYYHIQATKPDTIGIALSDSPIGLAAYLLEKYSTWSNPIYRNRDDGGLLRKYNIDDLIDNIMIYYLTKSITSSMRIYASSYRRDYLDLNLDRIPIEVPSACLASSTEIFPYPKGILKERYRRLVHHEVSKTGKFLGFESPVYLARQIYIAVEKFQNFYEEMETEYASLF